MALREYHQLPEGPVLSFSQELDEYEWLSEGQTIGTAELASQDVNSVFLLARQPSTEVERIGMCLEELILEHNLDILNVFQQRDELAQLYPDVEDDFVVINNMSSHYLHTYHITMCKPKGLKQGMEANIHKYSVIKRSEANHNGKFNTETWERCGCCQAVYDKRTTDTPKKTRKNIKNDEELVQLVRRKKMLDKLTEDKLKELKL